MSRLTRILFPLARRGFFRFLPDKPFLDMMFLAQFRHKVPWEHPVTFNEKIQWLKLYGDTEGLSILTDKIRVKDAVAEKIGREHVIPTLGTWDTPEAIPFDTLPDRFVLKCNHDSGGIVLCREKAGLDRKAAKRKLRSHLRRDEAWFGREKPYSGIERRILAEPFLEDKPGSGSLTDYKLHFFSGECRAIMVGRDRFSPEGLGNDYFTPEWEHFDFSRGSSHNAEVRSPRPPQLDEMIRLGKILAGDRPLVRVDFYLVSGQILFGELTFYPASGFNRFHPDSWDRTFGEWIRLPSDTERS